MRTKTAVRSTVRSILPYGDRTVVVRTVHSVENKGVRIVREIERPVPYALPFTRNGERRTGHSLEAAK